MMNKPSIDYPIGVWISTGPSTKQFGRAITEFIFEFKEEGKEATIINLFQGEYANTQAWIKGISGYYQNLSEVFEQYGKASLWIIAECIFENLN